MSTRKSPEDVQKIAAHARLNLTCLECGAGPGEPYIRPTGRSVHKGRYMAAAIELRRQERDARRTPEEAAELAAILAGLPRVSREEIEACRTPAGGYSFTRERLAAWGVPTRRPPDGCKPCSATRTAPMPSIADLLSGRDRHCSPGLPPGPTPERPPDP